MGVSIKDLGKEKVSSGNRQMQPERPAAPETVASFSPDELVRCWNAFAGRIEEKVYLKNTMINCAPVLKEHFMFEVTVHNPGQRDELQHAATDILGFLRYNLHNTQIQMQIRIDETNTKRLAYTSAEKFNLLKDVNPVLSKLKDEFDLRIE